MKKQIKYWLIFAFAGVLGACYEDQSTLPDMSFAGIVIDTTGIPGSFRVGYLETFTVAPKVTNNGVTDNSLLYEWSVNELFNRNEPVIVLGNEMVFNGSIPNQINATYPYILRLKVTDPATGISRLVAWNVTVTSSFVDGLLVCDSPDGVTSDFSLLNNADVSYQWSNAPRIIRNILESSGRGRFAGLLGKLFYCKLGSYNNTVTAFTADNQMVQFNTLDFTMTDMDELFIYRPPMMPTYSIGKSNQDILLLTGDGIIVSQYVSLSKFSGIIDVPLAITTVNNKMITFDPRHNEGLPSGVWYDKGQGKFYWHYSKTFSMIYAPYSDDQSGGGGFNPGNYTGRSAIAGGVNIGNETMVMLMKEDATSNYEICVFSKDTDPPGAKALITIPTAGKTLLDGALGYEFDRTSQVLYVVRNEGIYAITYGANPANVPAGAKFSAPAGETMVLAKVFEEGNYVSGDPYFSPLPLHHTSLIVATSTSGGAAGGKVYILPMVNPGTGNLDVANAIVYDGFGQILDVINLGY